MRVHVAAKLMEIDFQLFRFWVGVQAVVTFVGTALLIGPLLSTRVTDMSSSEAPEDTGERHDFYEPSPYPSIIVNRGALPESW